MLSHEESVRLDNFKAQYQSILGNISTANSDLERLLADKASKEAEVASLCARITALTDEVRVLEKKYADTINTSEKRLKALTDKQEASETDRAAVVEETAALKKQSGELTSAISTLRRELEELSEERAVHEKTVTVLTGQVASLSAEVADLSTQVSALRREHSALSEAFGKDSESHEAEKEQWRQEIEALKRKVEEERAKVVDYEEHVAKDKELLSRRERDIQVVTRRLKELFNEIKPGTALKI